VVADLDPEIAFAFKFAKGLTPEQLERLRRKNWVGDKATSASSTRPRRPTTRSIASTASPT